MSDDYIEYFKGIPFDNAMNTPVSFDIPEQRKAHIPAPANLSLIERMKKNRVGKRQGLHDDSLRHWVRYVNNVVERYLK